MHLVLEENGTNYACSLEIQLIESGIKYNERRLDIFTTRPRTIFETKLVTSVEMTMFRKPSDEGKWIVFSRQTSLAISQWRSNTIGGYNGTESRHEEVWVKGLPTRW